MRKGALIKKLLNVRGINKIKQRIQRKKEEKDLINNIDFDDDDINRFIKTKKNFKNVITTYKDSKIDNDLTTGKDYNK